MKKSFVFGSLILLVLLILGGGWAVSQQHTTQTTPATTKPTKPKRPSNHLTVTELKQHEKLRYAAIIYYALKYTKLQRWQEASDFKAGWQVEVYPHHGHPQYLVWPDKNATDQDKNLEPNRFKLTAKDTVTYNSFIVHSFSKDMTQTTSLTKIAATISHHHKGRAVRQMVPNLTVKTHHN
ncbi:hypothetical protein [Levilactobacillus yonginensis]|uniref:hypothetical protein n=1 Tax=Levilactobacillus yonginensis TaxID=1054041 RepID=UPI000F76FF25|nr:hypothetical protein [Levilactobacillus yonginensis]